MSIWIVGFSHKANKQKEKLLSRERDHLNELVKDLQRGGPVQYAWPNFSKLGIKTYHCHLSHKWVACWTVEDGRLKIIEIYYVGSR